MRVHESPAGSSWITLDRRTIEGIWEHGARIFLGEMGCEFVSSIPSFCLRLILDFVVEATTDAETVTIASHVRTRSQDDGPGVPRTMAETLSSARRTRQGGKCPIIGFLLDVAAALSSFWPVFQRAARQSSFNDRGKVRVFLG